jgi:hypothetical protein
MANDGWVRVLVGADLKLVIVDGFAGMCECDTAAGASCIRFKVR